MLTMLVVINKVGALYAISGGKSDCIFHAACPILDSRPGSFSGFCLFPPRAGGNINENPPQPELYGTERHTSHNHYNHQERAEEH
jgi:hypothetical protein